MRHRVARLVVTAIAIAAVVAGPQSAAAETSKLRIIIQNGLMYLTFAVMKQERLIEKEAEKAGLKGLEVTLQRVTGGNLINDAIISGNADIGATGTAFITLWARTRGSLDVKGIAAYNELSHKLLTLDPNINSIKDITDKDRITVPAVKTSTQALLLQMEAEKVWGVGKHDKLDPLTISRPHPDAVAALLSGKTEITLYFSGPPYQARVLQNPKAKVILTGAQVLGASPTGIVLTTSKFRAENPRVYKALLTALGQSMKVIKADPRKAAETYRTVFQAKESVDDLVAMMAEPGFDYDLAPKGQLKIAQFLYRTGQIKIQPESWKDMFFPEAHHLPGS